MRVTVVQFGARENYAYARMAQEQGVLSSLITDHWNYLGDWSQAVCRMIANERLLRAAGRRTTGIPFRKVSTVGSGFRWHARSGRDGRFLKELGANQHFGSLACQRIRDDSTDVFGYTLGSLEVMAAAREAGKRCVLAQYDPGPGEEEIVQEELARCSGLGGEIEPIPPEYFARVHKEWGLADIIVVNSDWSRKLVIDAGADSDKVKVVPLSIRPRRVRPRPERRGTLRVLWLGTVCVRKGIQYAAEAARCLSRLGPAVSFSFVGPSEVDLAQLRLPANSKYMGAMPRLATDTVYLDHDIFLFPTLSDGFGLTQLEAMSFGLPVIATNRCGDVVEHRKSGLVVEAFSGAAIASAIEEVLDSPALLSEMSYGALRRVEAFRPEATWDRMRSLGVFTNSGAPPSSTTI